MRLLSLLALLVVAASGCRSSGAAGEPSFKTARIDMSPREAAPGDDAEPTEREELYRRACSRYMARNYKGSIADATKVIRSCAPDLVGSVFQGEDEADRRKKLLPKAHAIRGLAWTGLGKHARAHPDYDRALELDPDCVEAWFGRGTSRLMAGEAQDAVAALGEAIRRSRELVPAYVNRGNARALQGEFFQALVDYNAAVELAPRLGLAYHDRALARQKTGDSEGAFEDWKKAAELDPSDEEAQARVRFYATEGAEPRAKEPRGEPQATEPH